MLGEECEVNTCEHYSEVDFCSCFMEGVAREQGESVYESTHDGKDGSHREYVVEVGYYVVCVVEDDVQG